MDIKKLSYFIAVVKYLNFTKAAQACCLTQTAMSRQISSLEDEVGVLLLERNNRLVSLTQAGEIFHRHAHFVLAAYEEMLHAVKVAGQNRIKALKIGFGIYEHSFVAALISTVCQSEQRLKISISQHPYHELITQLKIGGLDIIFTMPSSVEYITLPDTVVYPVHYSDLYLVVPHQHPYANEKTISVSALSECTFITINEDSGPCSLEQLESITRKSGLMLKKVITVNSLESQILMVEAGLGVAFMPSICKKHLTAMTKAILVEKFGGGEFLAMHQKNNKNPAIHEFFAKINAKPLSS